MSWRVVGHHNAAYSLHSGAPLPFYGPHPAKLWVGPARPLGYRRPRVVATLKSAATPTEYNATRAVL